MILSLLIWCLAPLPLAEPAPPPTLDTPETRQAVLRQALADFDAAVAMQGRGGAEAERLYRQALAGFESLLQSGLQNGGLYYNLGNTYVRLGEVGRAVVNYRRALRLMPGNERVRANLEAARRMCRVRIPPPATSEVVGTLFFWHVGTPLASRVKVGLAVYTLFWVIMLVRLPAGRRAPWLKWPALTAGLLALVLAASVTWDLAARQYRIEGVVIAESAELRKGNGEYYEPQLEQPLSAGVEFRLLESRPDVDGAQWYFVELPDGKKGWLRADLADII